MRRPDAGPTGESVGGRRGEDDQRGADPDGAGRGRVGLYRAL